MITNSQISKILKIVKIIFFGLLIFRLLGINVKATTSLNVTAGTTPGQSCTTHPTNRYCSLNSCNIGDQGQVWSFGDTNDSCNIYAIQFYVNTTIGGYTANTLKLSGSNFRNTNYYCTSSVGNCSVVFVSSSQLNVNFQNNGASGISNPQFQINAYNNGLINNGTSWKLTSITYLYNDIGSGQTDTDEIVNNQNSIAQEQMQNANENAEKITNKISELITDGLENSLSQMNNERKQAAQMCKNIIHTELKMGKRLLINGSLADGGSYNPSYYTEDYYLVPTGARYLYLNEPYNSKSGYLFIVYDQSFNALTYTNTATRGVAMPTGAYWFRYASPVSTTTVSVTSSSCVTSQDELNDYLKDNSDPTTDDNAINGVLGGVAMQDPLSYLLTLPLHLVQKINTILSQDTCADIQFGELYGSQLYLPCIEIEDYLGSSLWNTIDILMAVGLLAVTIKKFYDSVSNIITLGKEKEVRERLELPTPMEFLQMILGGDRS